MVITDANGGSKQLAHNADGQLISHTDALRQRTTWHYNEAGLTQQRQDANGTTLDYR